MKKDYIETDTHGQIVAVRCKLCGALLQALLPDARVPIRHRKVPGTVIQEISVRLQPTAAYDELELEMEDPDGSLSKHVTPICRVCKRTVTPEQARELYQADVDEWVRGAPKPEDKKRLAGQAVRKVRAILRGAD